MQKQLFTSIISILLIAAAIIMSGCPVGGGCRYKDYEGTVTITKIPGPSEKNGAPERPDDKLFIFYTFTPDGDAPNEVKSFSENMEVTRQQIEQKEIKVDRQFRAKAGYIERGSCNPGPYLEKVENWR